MIEAETSGELRWHYHTPPNTERKMLLLTTGRTAIVQRWGNGLGVIAWCPLPKRNKAEELRLGIE
jgi:hypothetical protein